MKRISVLLLGLLAAAIVAPATELKVKVYQPSAAEVAVQASMDTASDYSIQKAIARDYQTRFPDDMAVQLRVASFFATENLDSTRAWYSARAEREPGNPVALYLAGRLAAAPAEQRRYAQLLMDKDLNSYWGNLLVAGSYTAESDTGYVKTEAALRKSIAADNSLPMAVERLGHVYRARGDMTAADEIYQKLETMLPDRIEPVQYRMMLVQGDQTKMLALLEEFLGRNPNDVKALYLKARAQREKSDWPGHIETMRRVVAVQRTGDHAYDLACGYSLGGRPDSAFAYLFTAVDLGFADMEQYRADEDLVPLHDDSRWSELLTRVETAEHARQMEAAKIAAATAPQRKEEALAQRLNVTAADFALKDLDGKTVELSSLKGKVVILDFWATWCGPCKKSMPLIDQFYADKKKPKDVLVYGVNVWERGGNTDKVKPFIAERGFKFPILFGTNDLAASYGVQGIPTLVVIDKNGKVAYKHIGYDPTLPEILTWQTHELLK